LLLFFRPLANKLAVRDQEIHHESHAALLGVEPVFTANFVTLPDLRLLGASRHYLHQAAGILQEIGIDMSAD